MNKLLIALAFVGLVSLVGCSSTTTGGGAAGSGTFTIKPAEGNVTAVEVKHDSEKSIELTLDKKSEFKEDVALSVEVEPNDKGVTATVDPATIKKGDTATKASVKVKASDKAADGDYTVTVTGKPTKGDNSSTKIKVKVPPKKA